MVVTRFVIIDAFKDDDLAGWEHRDDVDDDDGEELHGGGDAAAAAAADGHQIPLWVISILSLLCLYPQSGMRELVSESLKHSSLEDFFLAPATESLMADIFPQSRISCPHQQEAQNSGMGQIEKSWN